MFETSTQRNLERHACCWSANDVDSSLDLLRNTRDADEVADR